MLNLDSTSILVSNVVPYLKKLQPYQTVVAGGSLQLRSDGIREASTTSLKLKIDTRDRGNYRINTVTAATSASYFVAKLTSAAGVTLEYESAFNEGDFSLSVGSKALRKGFYNISVEYRPVTGGTAKINITTIGSIQFEVLPVKCPTCAHPPQQPRGYG